MRSVSPLDCQSWLAPLGLLLDQNGWLQSVNGDLYPPLYVVVDYRTVDLSEISRRLLDWMPVGRERLLIVSKWWNYPPDQFTIFETIRKGCGVSVPLSEAPGHLFISTKESGTWYDDRPQIDVEEESVAMWLMGLMLKWTWQGYALVKGCQDAVWLGDGYVGFLSGDPARLDEAKSLVAELGLKSTDTFPWQFPKDKPSGE